MGLPGAGKTTFAHKLIDRFQKENKSFSWYNGDHIRKMYNDWDFSEKGRLRQTKRITKKANICKENKIIAICDYVCPTEELRKIFDADITVWIDTINKGRFEDTNKLFEPPTKYDIKVTDYNIEKWIEDLILRINNEDNNKE